MSGTFVIYFISLTLFYKYTFFIYRTEQNISVFDKQYTELMVISQIIYTHHGIHFTFVVQLYGCNLQYH